MWFESQTFIVVVVLRIESEVVFRNVLTHNVFNVFQNNYFKNTFFNFLPISPLKHNNDKMNNYTSFNSKDYESSALLECPVYLLLLSLVN